MIAFGPVPSRRLGRSLGVNNIPYKACTYSCVYCQIGRTKHFQVERQSYYDPHEIQEEIAGKCEDAGASGESIDYITFVPDGEPTLDENLARSIELVKPLGIKIAVITNSSLVWDDTVAETLSEADLVSCKIDSSEEEIWRKINRPHKSLSIDAILEGLLEFRKRYTGELITETMLVKQVNDGEENLHFTAQFLEQLNPQISYLSIPTRPPAEKWVQSPEENSMAQAYELFTRHVANVEYLIGYEGNAFAYSGDPEQDLLSITAVHPMREEAVEELLQKTGADFDVVSRMIEQGSLVETNYNGKKYYIRAWS
jgi:wyosine [tRNA(Phe)-imidazoG37] synthetase (radical SAM superfamily)